MVFHQSGAGGKPKAEPKFLASCVEGRVSEAFPAPLILKPSELIGLPELLGEPGVRVRTCAEDQPSVSSRQHGHIETH